jgi:hypothetical protein
MTDPRIYRTCGSCRQHINTETTDHVILTEVDGYRTYLHLRPCYNRYMEDVDEYESVERVLRHQHRS